MVQANHVHSPTLSPSQRWLGLSDMARTAKVIGTWARWASPACQLVRVAGMQIILQPLGIDDAGLRGQVLRSLENNLRDNAEPLELYCESLKDQNKPRDPAQRQKIQAWVEARKAIKIEGRNAQQ